ncbi:DUF3017 domain-containing protein [Streptomyces johnsoniae]|uniref:DUF3017 domain-containing protein n=1 Tax=Streptomyces johnsoniae TaxID=3075532 RepID=A0ABU2S5G8_9ACTN|nr:DUF3017 domain-containing protein [Streptomyces sp. DSM 41886]MDT0443674.1 DUF3017 domain-containing protein [Streptomyces sp. DSM 41886]
MGANGTVWRRRRRTADKYPTRGTARPEGGRRSAGGEAPAPIRQWPFLAVLGTVLAGLLITLADFRIGLLVVGGGLIGGGLLRGWLPAVGMLAVRSRFTDVVTYSLLGGVIVLLTLMAEPDPWLEVPFLSDVLRFSAG